MKRKSRSTKFSHFVRQRFPLLYDISRAVKFPLQVLALCVAMMIAVKFYDSRYSYNASLNNSSQTATVNNAVIVSPAAVTQPPNRQPSSDSLLTAAVQLKTTAPTNEPDPSETQTGETQTSSTEAPPEPEPKPKPKPKPTTQTNTTATPLDLEQDSATVQSETAVPANEPNLSEKASAESSAVLSALATPPEIQTENLEPTQGSNPTTQATAPATQIYLGLDWILEQDSNHYIAQIAATTEQQDLQAYAEEHPLEPQFVIYPFKLNVKGEVVYALSTKLFNRRTAALDALPELNREYPKHGVWLRKVANVQTEIEELKRARAIQ